MSLTSSPDVSLVLLSLLPLLCAGQFPLPGRGQFPGGVGGPRGVSSVEDLIDTIPGVPGDDYPIYATVSSTTLLSPCDSTSSLLPQVPDSSFTCPGRVDGGYYSDPEADCQAFHICAGDGTGGLTKYSFLCPNGTLFNQQYFVCDWWFNVDCSKVEDFYYLNEKLGADEESVFPGPEGSNLGSYRPGSSSGTGVSSLGSYRPGQGSSLSSGPEDFTLGSYRPGSSLSFSTGDSDLASYRPGANENLSSYNAATGSGYQARRQRLKNRAGAGGALPNTLQSALGLLPTNK